MANAEPKVRERSGIGRGSTGADTGGRASVGDKARSESEITSSIDRKREEINGLALDIRVAEEKLREPEKNFRRAQDILNDRLALNSQYRFARQLKREAIQMANPLRQIIRSSTGKQNKLIAEIKKDRDLLRSVRK